VVPAGEDDWGRPTYAADTVVGGPVATVPGRVAEVSEREKAELAQAGSVVSEVKIYAFPNADIRKGDTVVKTNPPAETFFIDSVINAAGQDHHLECLGHRVTR
jgi:hypothetical protein